MNEVSLLPLYGARAHIFISKTLTLKTIQINIVSNQNSLKVNDYNFFVSQRIPTKFALN
jgi:hypothetical protein